MPGAFWHSWQLWEKLCFVLAAGIVCVITLGCLKLTHNNWRLRKYARIRHHALNHKREMRHSASVKRGRAKEVPFGVRALEKGVEVEGVWNSRVNTPAPSQPSSPILSATTMIPKHQRASTTAPVETQKPGDLLTSDQSCRNSRQPYEPRRSSGLRFSRAHGDRDLERGEALAQLEMSHQYSSGPSPSSSGSPEDLPVDDQPLNTVYHIPNSSQFSFEDNPFLTPSEAHKFVAEPIPLSYLNNLVLPDAQSDPAAYHTQLLSVADRAYASGHAQPFHTTSMAAEEHGAGTAPAQPFPSFEAERQQVVRKINSGFEILKPGTLGAPRQSANLGSQWREVGLGGKTEKKGKKKLQKKAKRESLV